MDLGGDGHELRQGIIEELLIRPAEVTLATEITSSENGSVLQAAAPAERKMPANETFIAEILF